MVGMHAGHMTKTWNYDSKSSLLVPPTVADLTGDGKLEIIVCTSKGDLIVLDAQAQELWRYSVQEKSDAVEEMFLDQDVMNSINAAPALADINGDGKPEIIFGSERGILYVLNQEGRLIWKFNTSAGIRSSPTVADLYGDGKQAIIFGTTDNYLYIVNAEGKLVERFKQPAPIESTPGFFKGLIYFGCDDGTFTALTPQGEVKWSYKTKGKITAAPVFGALRADNVDYVVIGSTDNNLYCFDTDGELSWIYETEGAIYSEAVLADLNKDGKLEVVTGSCDNNVHAVTADGDRFWTYETDFWVVSKPIVADIDGDGELEVIIGSYDHNLYILNSKGSYLLDYVPGISGVVQQAGHYSEIMTQEPGQHVGKKLWQFRTDGVVVGCAQVGDEPAIVVTTKTGLVNRIQHKV